MVGGNNRADRRDNDSTRHGSMLIDSGVAVVMVVSLCCVLFVGMMGCGSGGGGVYGCCGGGE